MPKRVQDKDGLGRGVPTGTVFPFAGSTAPDGWLLCDGTSYAIATYKRLSDVLSTTWDTATNQLTGSAYASPGAGNFRVPDLRGTFLRGTVSSSTLHPTNVTLAGSLANKTKKNGLTLSGSVAGGTASLTGTTTFGSSSHSHSAGGILAEMFHSSGGAIVSRMVGSSGWSANRASNASALTPSGTETSAASAQGSSGSPSATASVGISSTSANNGTLNVSAGDNETAPNYTGIQYIIKY